MASSRSASHAIKHLVQQSNFAYGLVGRYRERPEFGRRVVRRGDDCVIEGFPRSANTFATKAFRSVQAGPLNIGNHCHAPAQVSRAAKFDIPCMVLVREPEPAITSYLLYTGGRVGPLDAIEKYCAFYRSVLPYASHWSLAPFEEVVTDFSQSIERLNRRSGASFAVYNNSTENDDVIRAAIEEQRMSRIKSKADAEASARRNTAPSAEKTEMRKQLRAQLDTREVRDALGTADDLYERIMASGQV